MIKDNAEEEKDDVEKINYVEFLRSTGHFNTSEINPNNVQNLNNSPKKREHVSTLGNSKSLPQLQSKEKNSKNMDSEISNNVPCTFYEAILNSDYSTDKTQECTSSSDLAGPPTVSALPKILRPSKRWYKKTSYSLDSSPKILTDMKTITHADLLHMPTICSPSVESTATGSDTNRTNDCQSFEDSSESKKKVLHKLI
ncbi:unnamed protein product [Onchocerca ochengi]|uniref:Uncharacterized protein n=1 Tax=Onchocerca ochengi TaxID=42157 RepID=A0A182EAI1_ONCOC|nr:unnamed protein product [Onchocerca ochengi]